jgi:hypothetical protein
MLMGSDGTGIALLLRAKLSVLDGMFDRAPWRFAVLDNEGYLLLAGATRHRPTKPDHTLPAAEGGLVELHLTAELLADLARDPAAYPGWVAVIADIAAQFADRRRLITALGAHPTSRHARGPLLRDIQVRDRTCIAPGCRRQARRCDADHTHAYTEGGATTAANVGPLCPRHHALKHRGGWQLRQPRPGHFRWRSPLGRRYTTRGEPIMPPLPEPCPGPLPPESPATGPANPATSTARPTRRGRRNHTRQSSPRPGGTRSGNARRPRTPRPPPRSDEHELWVWRTVGSSRSRWGSSPRSTARVIIWAESAARLLQYSLRVCAVAGSSPAAAMAYAG